jgi:hypothetical protein
MSVFGPGMELHITPMIGANGVVEGIHFGGPWDDARQAVSSAAQQSMREMKESAAKKAAAARRLAVSAAHGIEHGASAAAHSIGHGASAAAHRVETAAHNAKVRAARSLVNTANEELEG